MAGLTTAWELSRGDWRRSLAGITVYQRGWRLGGKGASSRGRNGRIEEHGLHVLLGSYDATFRVLRECYGELDRPRTDPGCPILTWRDAVRPSGDIGLADPGDEGWDHFVTRFSTNDLLPGEPGAEDRELTPVEVARRSVQMLLDFHRSTPPPGPGEVFLSTSPDATTGPRGALVADAVRTAGLTTLALALETARTGTGAATVLGSPGFTEAVDATLAGIRDRVRDGLRRAIDADTAARRTWYLVDLVVTNLRGMVVDGLLLDAGAYRAIDHLDYGEWLQRHGADAATVRSPIVRGMYDLVFAYVDGDRDRPRFSAGVGLTLAGRMLFDFKGGIFWKMQAGMGEIVFAPLYEALSRRGVEFRFFHRLDEVRLHRTERSVAEVTLGRQAEPLEGIDRYQPLVRVGRIPCWPDRPDTDQLAPGLATDDLESHWAPRSDTGTVTLRRGVDFDVAVLAVSVGMIPHVCRDLVATDPRWAAMVGNIATVGTQAFQLWLDVDERDLGWAGPEGTTLSGFAAPFDTWASMSHLLAHEPWDGPDRPRTVAYFCGSLPVTGVTDHSSAGAAADGVRAAAIRFIDEELPALWPKAVDGDGRFRWDMVHAGPAGPEGADRFDTQYWRANVDPSDRYVQSVPGSDMHRLRPDGSGYDNLFLAGDWTDCGLNAGCVEAATRSGILAGRAILGGAAPGVAGR